MNECAVVRRLLAKRPAEWSESERQRVTSHLADCADCAALARDYAEQHRRLGALPLASLTGMQRRELHARLERARRQHRIRARLSTAAAVVLGVAVLVAIILVASLLLRASGPGKQPITGTTPVPSVRLPTPPPQSPYPGLPTPTQESDYPPPLPPTVESEPTVTATLAPILPTQPSPGP